MEISPPVRYDELDHTGHDEEAERREPRGKAQHKQDWKRDFGEAGEMSHHQGNGEIIGPAEDMELELLLEEIGRARR